MRPLLARCPHGVCLSRASLWKRKKKNSLDLK
jgi:hypothetical protein